MPAARSWSLMHGTIGGVQRPRPGTIVRWVVTVALAIAFSIAVGRLWGAARQRGRDEAARHAQAAARSAAATTTIAGRPGANGTTTTGAGGTSTTIVGDTSTTAAALVLGAAGQVQALRIDASGVAQPAQDSCGKTVSYDAAKAQDDNPGTAWRVPGDGVGATLKLTLAGPTHLREVGLLPGYAKRDLCTEVDRFPQVRRITAVRWRFDQGTPVTQSFKDRADIQSVPVDVTTTTITIEILATTSDPILDYTAISEIRLAGEKA